MKPPAKLARHEGRRKPWSESHQTIVCCSVLVALMAFGIWAADRFIPKAPLQPRAHLSLQESRR